MVKTYFTYDNEDYWFLTPNWSPYGHKYDWWMKGERIQGRIIDREFVEELTIMYERRLKLNKIITKTKNYEN